MKPNALLRDFGAQIKLAEMSVQLVFAKLSHISTFSAQDLCLLCCIFCQPILPSELTIIVNLGHCELGRGYGKWTFFFGKDNPKV